MLTDLAIRRARPTPKPRKLADQGGLYLLLMPNGARWWRYNYRFHGQHRTLSFGVYDTVTLAAAREKHAAAVTLLRAGTDPATARRQAKIATHAALTFAAVADEWATKQTWARKTRAKKAWLLRLINAHLSTVPVGAVTATDVVHMALAVEDRISSETAHRAKQTVGQVLRYAVATGRAPRDVTVDVRGALQPIAVRHRSALTEPAAVGGLLRAIDGLAFPIVRVALQLAALTFVRPGEIRSAAWVDLDLEAAVWRIPAAKMKMREAHIVPLAPQAVAVLQEIQEYTGGGTWVFPAVRTPRRPMSDATMNAALRRLGYTTAEMTAHGFRAMARTLLAEVLLVDPYYIEAQLAHATPGPLGAAYARTQYLTQRTAMMTRWADYLDALRAVKG